MRKLMIINLMMSFIVSAQENWTTVKYFEEVGTFELMTVEYDIPLVFDWGAPIDVSGNAGVVPEWADLLKTNSDLLNMNLAAYQELFTTNCWPTIGIDSSNFNKLKEFRVDYQKKFPEARYLLVYAEAHIRIDNEEFAYLLTAVGEDIATASSNAEARRQGDVASYTAKFIKKEGGQWRHHLMEPDQSVQRILDRIPLSYRDVVEIKSSKKAYYDASDKKTTDMKAFAKESIP